MRKNHPKTYDEQTQDQLYNKYVLPHEKEIMEAVLKVRNDFDELMLEKQMQVWYAFPSELKKRHLSKPKATNTIADYPKGHCNYIKNYVYSLFGEAGEELKLGICGEKLIIEEKDILKQIKIFKAKGGIVKQIHLIVENDGEPYFQNVIQVGNRYIDTSTDQEKEKTKVKLFHIKGQKKYRDIKDFEDDIDVGEKYRGTVPFISTEFLGVLSLYIPHLLISNNGELDLPSTDLIRKNALEANFRLSRKFLKRELENPSIISIPEDIRTNLIYACKIFLELNINETTRDVLIFLIGNLERKNNTHDLLKLTNELKSILAKCSKEEKTNELDFYCGVIQKITEIYNTLIHEGLI